MFRAEIIGIRTGNCDNGTFEYRESEKEKTPIPHNETGAFQVSHSKRSCVDDYVVISCRIILLESQMTKPCRALTTTSLPP
jgi:hypothetical protein